MADDFDDLTQSSDTATEDLDSPTSGYRHASLLIQKLDSVSFGTHLSLVSDSSYNLTAASAVRMMFLCWYFSLRLQQHGEAAEHLPRVRALHPEGAKPPWLPGRQAQPPGGGEGGVEVLPGGSQGPKVGPGAPAAGAADPSDQSEVRSLLMFFLLLLLQLHLLLILLVILLLLLQFISSCSPFS